MGLGDWFKTVVEQYGLHIAITIGGVVDYVNQVQRGDKCWNVMGFIIHLLNAVFFGWAVATLASGYEYNIEVVKVSGAVGAFLGVRVADLLTYKILGDRRAK